MGEPSKEKRDVEAVDNFGQPVSILELYEELKETEADVAEDPRAIATLLERMVYAKGQRTAGGLLAPGNSEQFFTTYKPHNFVSKNKLRSSVLSWSARIAKRNTTAIAYPSGPEESDLAIANCANAFLDHHRQLQSRERLLQRACLFASMHGSVAFYVQYDPDFGSSFEKVAVTNEFGAPVIDEMGQIVTEVVPAKGNPRVELLTIFDYFTDGAKCLEDAEYVVIRRQFPKAKAKTILLSVGIEDEPEEISGHSRMTGTKTKYVEALEIYFKPAADGRFANGLMVQIVDGHVTRAMDYPFTHGELPIVSFNVMDIPDEYYGSTWLEDAIPLQVGLNHTLQAISHRFELSRQVKLILSSGLRNKWNNVDGIDEVGEIIEAGNNDDVERGHKFVDFPSIPADIYQMAQIYEQSIDDVSGIADIASQGDAAAKTRNAKLVQFATEIDEQKSALTISNLDDCMVKVDRLVLELYRQYVTTERLVTMVGPDNSIGAEFFRASELAGVDVRLEPGPASSRTGAAMAADAEAKMQQGLVDPATGMELMDTGLSSTKGQAIAYNKMYAAVMQSITTGEVAQPDPMIMPNDAIKALRLLAKSEVVSQNPQAKTMVLALMQQYTDMSMGMAAQQVSAAPLPMPQSQPEEQQAEVPQ